MLKSVDISTVFVQTEVVIDLVPRQPFGSQILLQVHTQSQTQIQIPTQIQIQTWVQNQ